MTDSEVASPTPVTQLSFDPFAVDELEDAELDTLAHGAIALDAGIRAEVLQRCTFWPGYFFCG